jgi:hypothetical protein
MPSDFQVPGDGPVEQVHATPNVQQLLQHMLPSDVGAEQRQTQRFPYPFLVELTPVGDDDTTPVDSPMTVIGKDLSERGIGFFHQKPLPYRRVQAMVEDMTGQRIAVLIDLTWCRFKKQGWYESGGRFLHVAVDRPGQEFRLPATG